MLEISCELCGEKSKQFSIICSIRGIYDKKKIGPYCWYSMCNMDLYVHYLKNYGDDYLRKPPKKITIEEKGIHSFELYLKKKEIHITLSDWGDNYIHISLSDDEFQKILNTFESAYRSMLPKLKY